MLVHPQVGEVRRIVIPGTGTVEDSSKLRCQHRQCSWNEPQQSLCLKDATQTKLAHPKEF